jgi:hypothetical protein
MLTLTLTLIHAAVQSLDPDLEQQLPLDHALQLPLLQTAHLLLLALLSPLCLFLAQ